MNFKNICPNKKLSQNFLVDKNILEKIVNSVDFSEKKVVEIGGGTGLLTTEIKKKNPKELNIIEIDVNLIENLKTIANNVKLGNCLEEKISTEILIGNLPYHISSEIIMKASTQWDFEIGAFMFQKEFAERLLEKSGKNYGLVSVIFQNAFEFLKIFHISPNCFFPVPKVWSSFIIFKKKKNLSNDFIDFTANLIKNRRKKISNIINVPETFKNLSDKRPDNLSAEEIMGLFILKYL